VLLNGKTPDYLVGHSDEFNHDWLWKQELIVPAGTHQITLLRDNREIWSGEVTVAANQRVIIDANKGTQRATDWPRGQKLASLPRFKAGMASATVPVAPTKIASFAASPTPINCGDSANLSWETQDAVEARLENQQVETSGSQSVSPRGNTTYTLVAAGPGGRVEKQAGVDVNTTVTASLNANPGEVRYRRIGEKVVEQGNATLNWSTGNASSVSISPLGSVEESGTRSVEPAPGKTTTGPVSETVTYTLTATNDCGGTTTQTAMVRVAGSIEPPPEIALASIFFPTDYPDQQNPSLGLLSSQKRALAQMVEGFKKYLEYNSNARLLLEGNADERASTNYNQSLSERRVARVKQFLVDAGIPASVIETMAIGEDKNLERNEVKELEQGNPSTPPRNRVQNLYADWLAHNRRVDVVLRASIHRSQRYYPHSAPDSGILWQVPKPGRRAVEQNE
jgi:peptidoglycan-associated lipoprotein